LSSGGPEISQALARLDAITRRLRAECPWDREQNERTIVPHTVEEAYELADAANRHDDAKLLDELGDVLFQVHFLSLLLEERGAGDLAQVAEHCTEKLPGPLYARKLQRRAASSGFDFPGIEGALGAVYAELAELEAASGPEERFHELGDVLFAAVNVARKMHVDPELALRAASERFRSRVTTGTELAASEGRTWNDLGPDEQLAYYARARLTEGDPEHP
jgi:uncharacterized protein YabN with tetrapyrrole methylase and pyrophosphatase domain